jgi:acyl carrier protein
MMHTDSQTPSRIIPERDDVLRDVTQIVAEQMGMEVDQIEERNALVDDLGCDSLDIVEISMELEDHFDLSIPDGFDEKARTIGDVTDGVLQLLAGSSPS